MEFAFTFTFPMQGGAAGPEIDFTALIEQDTTDGQLYAAEIHDEDGTPLSDKGPIAEAMWVAIAAQLFADHADAIEQEWAEYEIGAREAAAENAADARRGL